ncbi:hypothetical protein VNO80_25774 [Phaseolus coccineus]|uniref:Histone H2A C-terminal domain-containing protein n=1 Tax=Phaseolus coccineus TaxID=3886 RepID=A0AAN9M043_PHACN
MAVRNDEKLGKLLSDVTIAHGGILPNINLVLLSKKIDKASKEPKSLFIYRNLLFSPKKKSICIREQMLKVQVVDGVESTVDGGGDEETPFEASLKWKKP